MKARLLAPHNIDGGYDNAGRHVFTRVDAGHVIDNPDAYLLVLQGAAEPADEECAAASSQTPEARAAAQAAYEMTRLGIVEEDRDAFRAGAMLGYDPSGDWIPGPNYDAWCAAQDAAAEEDDAPESQPE